MVTWACVFSNYTFFLRQPLIFLTKLKSFIAGWGISENYCEESRRSVSILQETDIQILPEEECEQWEGAYREWNSTLKRCLEFWYSNKGGHKILAYTLCGKHPTPGIVICHGDSGGPLTVKHDGHHVLVGITSGAFGCGLVRFVLAANIQEQFCSKKKATSNEKNFFN